MIPTPICDFVRAYADSRPARLHMPGHKGRGPLGFESLDITEIDGADDLFAPSGIISGSEAVASRLFGARTFYSTEGSSLAIRAMLFAALGGAPRGERPLVLAGRNAHRAFLSAAALLDLDVEWLYPRAGQSLHGCAVSPADVEAALSRLSGRCRAVYLTSPDYLGGLCDIAGIAAACRRRGVRLLVDGAHGAYLKFLPRSLHPIDLGADMCCDSAHKTLPALTGAAYLHVSPASKISDSRVRKALALFGSSSPSWLILQSLDACNRLLADFPARLSAFLPKLDALREALAAHGYALTGDEPMKLTICARPFGTTGDALAASLAREGVTCEFHDPDFLTLMPSPMNTDDDLRRLQRALLRIPPAIPGAPEGEMPSTMETGAASGAPARRLIEYPAVGAPENNSRPPERAMSIREATFAPGETLPLELCEGRVLAAPALSCPPCVPIAICGERLDANALERLRYYGVRSCEVCLVNKPNPEGGTSP